MRLIEVLLGRALATRQEQQQRIGPLVGVGMLGLDALASAAYGPEALLTALLPIGRQASSYVLPLTLAIVALLALVALSYRQIVPAYPGGGGAYMVAKQNLGDGFGLLAAAALALDYVLNVAVAISAGVGALVSAVPRLLPHSLGLCLATLGLLTLLNLRGVRSTGLAFLVPTYAFLASMGCVLGLGLFGGRWVGSSPASGVVAATAGAPSAWLLLRAFANGCTAMTGVEAVSNGVPLFRRPETRGARQTLAMIVFCLVALLVGIAALARQRGVLATAPGAPGYQSIISRLASGVLGRGALYECVMASVIAVLALSANTSFADFPRVCRLLALDGFLPESFAHRGRRLAFSRGIVLLALLSSALLSVFGGITDLLIPLFAVGALSAFTLSQLGMVVHWRRKKLEPGSGAGLLLNAAGALATGLTLLAVLISKLTEGAWVSVALVALLLLLLRGIRRHHDLIDGATAVPEQIGLDPGQVALAIVPLRRWDAVSAKALRVARGLSANVLAVQVLTGEHDVDDLSQRWSALTSELEKAGERAAPRLEVVRSEYRELYAPLLEVVARAEKAHEKQPIVVVLGELQEPRWYHRLLHAQTALLLKALLLQRGGPQTLIVTVPFYLRAWRPEQRLLRRSRPARA